MRRTLTPTLLAALLFCLSSVASPSDAEAGIFEVWARTHGTAATGTGYYFEHNGGPYIGFGGQVGVRVLFLEVYTDINWLDQEDAANEDGGIEKTRTYFNQIGGGVYFGLPIPGKLNIAARANVNYLYSPFVENQVFYGTGGVNLRIGGQIEYEIGKMGAFGADVHVGYAPLGNITPQCGEANCDREPAMGLNTMLQLYLEFNLP